MHGVKLLCNYNKRILSVTQEPKTGLGLHIFALSRSHAIRRARANTRSHTR